MPKKMKFEKKHLQPLDKPLIGFGGNQVTPLGTIILPVRVGEKDGSRTMPIRFTVVELTFPYNAIMGLPLINKIKAAIFPHQLLLQFERDDFLGLPRFLLPSTMMLSILLTGEWRVFFCTCPNYLNLFSRILSDSGATPNFSLNS